MEQRWELGNIVAMIGFVGVIVAALISYYATICVWYQGVESNGFHPYPTHNWTTEKDLLRTKPPHTGLCYFYSWWCANLPNGRWSLRRKLLLKTLSGICHLSSRWRSSGLSLSSLAVVKSTGFIVFWRYFPTEYNTLHSGVCYSNPQNPDCTSVAPIRKPHYSVGLFCHISRGIIVLNPHILGGRNRTRTCDLLCVSQ